MRSLEILLVVANLLPGNHPYFVPAGDGERTGTV